VKRGSIAAAVGVLATLSLALGACMTTGQKEDMLAAAGFKIKLADTPQKIASLKAFPPHKFFAQNQNNQVVYFYADPTVCRCLYYGNQAAYQTYRQMAFQQNLVNQQQMTAEINQQTAFDFGPWGGPFWY
jgi:replication-associated recombination protein RarA